MGKATILSGGAAGSYTVKLDTGKATQTARLAALDARLAELVPLVETAQGYLSVSLALEQTLEAAANVCIDDYVAATRTVPLDTAAVKTALDAYTAAAKKLQVEKGRLAQEQIKVDLLLAEQAQATKDRAKWAALVLEETTQAWCADLTEDATGDVATIEIPGENKLVLIAPDAPAPVAADGLLTAREVQSGPQVFWNAAALPGWQKWMPTYRRGTITALNREDDLADVTLTDDVSSAQKLGINQTPALTGVPVQYMTCNSRAFEVGDRCVVKFKDHDWAQPKVIGFVDNPKPCDLPDLHLVFCKPDTPASAADVVARCSAAVLHKVNHSGLFVSGGMYHTLGLLLNNTTMVAGVELPGETIAEPFVSYEIVDFYDGKAVMMRDTKWNETSGDGMHDTLLYQETKRYTHGPDVLAEGLYTVSIDEYKNELGTVVSSTKTETYTNYVERANPTDELVAHPAAIRSSGPWASWNAVAWYVRDGQSVEVNGESITDTIELGWQTQSLPAPRNNTPVKPLVDLAAMPARVSVDTVRAYTSASMATTPLDRHLLDFGYLPYRIDGLKVRAVGKDVAWSWLEGEGEDYTGPTVIRATNYKTGQSVAITKPELFPPSVLPADYMPKNLVFADTWAARAEADPTGPFFWVWIYSLNITTGLTLVKTITNKPGDLSAGGHVGLVQVSTPSLPPDCYLIGALRDEVACM